MIHLLADLEFDLTDLTTPEVKRIVKRGAKRRLRTPLVRAAEAELRRREETEQTTKEQATDGS